MRAFQHYRGRLDNRFDIVVDQVNTIPFFTPLWANVPVVMMIWQLAREVWWYESRFPLNFLGHSLEPIYLRAYRDVPVLTFSASTAADLQALSFRGDISTLPVGIGAVETEDAIKESEPTFVYVGRLAPSKRVTEIVEAFAFFYGTVQRGRLLLIGDGAESYVRRIARRAAQLAVSDHVELIGWLRGSEKHRRMATAHALVMASAREGWGLVVTECNACGTPAVVYDVPGLRDSVRHMTTGLVVPPDSRSLADGMLELVGNPDLYARLREEGLKWSRTLTYTAATRCVQERLEAIVASGLHGNGSAASVGDQTSPT